MTSAGPWQSGIICGDQYPFPYSSPDFIETYAALLQAVDANQGEEALRVHQKLRKFLLPLDFEYLTWQEWKEGFARLIENRLQWQFQSAGEPLRPRAALSPHHALRGRGWSRRHPQYENHEKVDGKLLVYFIGEPGPAEINEFLHMKGINLSHLSDRKRTLEQHFLELLQDNQ